MPSAFNTTEAAGVGLSVVIPAFNEADNLEPVVRETLAAFEGQPSFGSFELIIVDDGSTDGTAAVADRLAQAHAPVTAIHHPANRGFGAALRSGFTASRGRLVTLITADGEVGPDQVIALIDDMGDADLMLGRRERTVSLHRHVLTFGLNLVMRLILGFVPDATGIYIVRGDLLRKMDLQSDTGLANLEVLLYCRQLKCRIRTGLTHIRPRLSGTSKVTNAKTMARTLWEMLKLRVALRRRLAGASTA